MRGNNSDNRTPTDNHVRPMPTVGSLWVPIGGKANIHTIHNVKEVTGANVTGVCDGERFVTPMEDWSGIMEEMVI